MSNGETIHHCRYCNERIRRVRPGDSHSSTGWMHQHGNVLCELPRLTATPINLELLTDVHAAEGCASCREIAAKRK